MSSLLYQPLSTPSSTRVLTLLPGPPNSPLTARLHEVDLSTNPIYDAISYTWGSDTSTNTITINDTTVQIRHNLFNFLLQLRSHSQRDPLWVDAISISQTDLVEKGQQVSIIGEIFRAARSVLIWVGTHSHDSHFLFQPWLCPAHTSPVVPPKFRDSKINSAIFPFFNKQVHISPPQQQQRFHVWMDFLKREYWGRLWIIQEVILAKTLVVHCGHDRATWEDLVHARTQPWMNDVFDGVELDKLPQHFHQPQAPTGTQARPAPQNDPTAFASADSSVQLLRKAIHNLVQLDCLRHQRSSKGRPFIVHNIHAANTAFPASVTTLRREAYDVAHLNLLFPHAKCVDQKDHVYGLLALEKDGDHGKLIERGLRGRISPDYTIDEAELFVRVCEARFEAWRGGMSGLSVKMGYLSGQDPDGRKREFVESMEKVLLHHRILWEKAVDLLKAEISTASTLGKKSERQDMQDVLMVLKLSGRIQQGWGAGIDGMHVHEKERQKMDKMYAEFKKRRDRTQA